MCIRHQDDSIKDTITSLPIHQWLHTCLFHDKISHLTSTLSNRANFHSTDGLARCKTRGRIVAWGLLRQGSSHRYPKVRARPSNDGSGREGQCSGGTSCAKIRNFGIQTGTYWYFC